ncbi:hypothetical protein [Limnohabitans sp. DM1]|uniref:hypothetical protein n=1 Tax=Limnohabitans sp. DM1 TaxID=1597955 RepID=UPI001892B559|nr:hypothetical protein [Limnohabitans sp. DM1]
MAIASVPLATLVLSSFAGVDVCFGKGKLGGADSCAAAVISTPPGTSRLDKIMVASPNASRALFMAARAFGAKNF